MALILRFPPQPKEDNYKFLLELWKAFQTQSFDWSNIEEGTIPSILSGVIIKRAFKQVSADYTTNSLDDVIQVIGNATITLHSAADQQGRELQIDNKYTSELTVNPFSGEAIEGETSQPLPVDSSMALISDGTQWRFM